MKLYLKNEIVKNRKKISDKAYISYLSISILLKNEINDYYISIPQLLYNIFHDTTYSHRRYSWIKEGIEDLNKLNYISISTEINQTSWIINAEKLISKDGLKDNTFTILDSEDIDKILNQGESNNILHNVMLLRFYNCLMSTIYNSKKDENEIKDKVGDVTLDRISKTFNYHISQVIEYMKELEDLKIIYFKRASSMIISTNEDSNEIERYVSVPGVYGKYNNKSIIKEYGINHENNYIEKYKTDNNKIVIDNKEKNSSNSTRSVKQKRNRIAKLLSEGSEIPYGYEECKYIYNQMIENNKIKKGQFVKESDYDVFKGFDFYNEDEIKYVEIIDCPYEANIDNVDMDNINFEFD